MAEQPESWFDRMVAAQPIRRGAWSDREDDAQDNAEKGAENDRILGMIRSQLRDRTAAPVA